MERSDVTELYYITAIENVPLILKHGILSHNQAEKVKHLSIAMPEIQDRRRNKKIPGGLHLHDYANLYFDAHNPMLSKCRSRNDEICILRVDSAVLDLQKVVIADKNAGGDWVKFLPVPAGLQALNKNTVYARYWTHPGNEIAEMQHKSIKCAEVLVPGKVDTKSIIGAYVANDTALGNFRELRLSLTVAIKTGIFF